MDYPTSRKLQNIRDRTKRFFAKSEKADESERSDVVDGRVQELEEENNELQLKVERQRMSLEHLATLIKAKDAPLDTLPLDIDEERVANLSVEEATLLTITNLREQIECMEDERSRLVDEMKKMKAEKKRFKIENEAQKLQVQTLEKLFRDINIDETGPTSISNASVDTESTNGSSEDSREGLPGVVVTSDAEKRVAEGKKLFVALPSASALLPEDDDYKHLFEKKPEVTSC